jgi:hypothetical protein
MSHRPLMTPLAVAVLAACGPDFTSRSGVRFFLDGDYLTITQQEAEEVEELLVPWLARVNDGYPEPVLRECLATTSVRLHDGLLPCGERTCIGVQHGSELLITKGGHCGYTSPYAHELFHRFQQCAGSRFAPDLEHREPTIWFMSESVPGMLLCTR